jgi:hypothetical protein
MGNKILRVNVLTQGGVLIRTINFINKERVDLNTSDLMVGFYLLQIFTESGISIGKLVIQ